MHGPHREEDEDVLSSADSVAGLGNLYDLGGRAINRNKAYHSYMKLHVWSTFDDEVLALHLDLVGAPQVYQVSPGEDKEGIRALFKMLEITAEGARACSEVPDKPFADAAWNDGMPLTSRGVSLERFFEDLKCNVRERLASDPNLKGVPWSHPWHPTYYNCNHFAGDCLQVVAGKAVMAFYDECLTHNTETLGLTGSIGKLKSETVRLCSRAVMKVSQPVSHTVGLFASLDSWHTVMPRDSRDWYIMAADIYWVDCTHLAMGITSRGARKADTMGRYAHVMKYEHLKDLNNVSSISDEDRREPALLY